MRRYYNILSGILLILPIIDFAITAPVPVQEKLQPSVDVVHIPKGVITVLGKRGGEELEHVVEEYFKTLGKPVDSSDAHALSSSAPPRPDPGSTNVVQAPEPNPAPSTANPGLLMEPSSPSKSDEGGGELHDVPLDIPTSSEYGSDHGLTGAPAPLPKLPRPVPPKEFGQTHGYQVEHVQQPNAGPLTGADPHFDWNYWANAPSPPRPSPPKPTDPKPSTGPGVKLKNWMNRLNLKDSLAPKPATSKPKPSTDSGVNWKHWINPLNLMDPLAPGVAASLKTSTPKPSTVSDFDREHWSNLKDSPPSGPASSKSSNPKPSTDSGVNWKHWINPLNLMDPLAPGVAASLKTSTPKPSTDSDFDWEDWSNLKDSPPSGAASSKSSNPKSWDYWLSKFDPAPLPKPGWSKDSKPLNPKPSDPGPSNPGPSNIASQPNLMPPRPLKIGPSPSSPSSPNLESPKEPEYEEGTPPSLDLGPPAKEPENEVVPRPPSTPESTGSEHNSDPQSLSTAVQPEDLRSAMFANDDIQAALYSEKGKAKESRRISGTARDVGNVDGSEVVAAC